MSLIIYTKTGCLWCIKALSYLNEKQIVYEEREVRNNPEFMKELEEKSGQNKTPTLDLDGQILADTDAEAIDLFLKENRII